MVSDAMSSLTEALEQREKELDEREETLRQDEERFKAECSVAYGETTPSDVLHLNVGGTKTAVLRRTLTAIPGSMLASKFSGRWDDSIEKDEDGHIFIDQDFTLFNIMVTYLRNKANGDDKFQMESPVVEDSNRLNFYRMIEYYGMTNGIYPTRLQPLRLNNDSVKMTGPRKVVSKKWETFKLALDGHSRKIKTYEVTLGKVQRIQIGWGCLESFSPDEEDVGVGEVNGTIALDLTRSSFLTEGSLRSIDGLEHPKGTVVLSKNYGSQWFVNGELVFDAEENEVQPSDIPLISIKGEFEVTSVELEI